MDDFSEELYFIEENKNDKAKSMDDFSKDLYFIEKSKKNESKSTDNFCGAVFAIAGVITLAEVILSIF
ncbi:hypothetical protein [Methanobrevibacter curvatus]|uniref:Uncharacterized protein n=1 Tax=Methanobrevibacter curvatus TaxID=49547 RepID=A0A165Z2C3_9EURY|nr:hypothetical protein [Methanobrevibacter curvatus]KZX10162.1 hypothetical protein MBCUR_18970 [Methanobrevibacter curvatus]